MKEDIARQTELDDIAKIMKNRAGRRFMWRMLEQAGIFQPTFSPDALVMSFQEGKRNQGLMLFLDIMTVDPNGYTLMANEAKARLEAKEMEDERRIEPE